MKRKYLIVLIANCIAVALAALYSPEPWLAIFVIFLAILLWTFLNRKLFRVIISLFLCGSLIIPFEPNKSKAQEVVPYTIGVVVIVVAGVVTYKLVRFCQRKFPKDKPENTNAPPDQVINPNFDSAGAAWTYAAMGSCYFPPSILDSQKYLTSPGPGVFDIECKLVIPDINHAYLTNIIYSWSNKPEDLQDFSEFQTELASHGLVISDIGNSFSFSLNDIPVTQTECPIKLLSDPQHSIELQITDCTYSKVVILERSYDMIEWSPMLRTVAQSGMKMRFQDAIESGSAFYRLRLETLSILHGH
jgi:hypothetical protein